MVKVEGVENPWSDIETRHHVTPYGSDNPESNNTIKTLNHLTEFDKDVLINIVTTQNNKLHLNLDDCVKFNVVHLIYDVDVSNNDNSFYAGYLFKINSNLFVINVANNNFISQDWDDYKFHLSHEKFLNQLNDAVINKIINREFNLINSCLDKYPKEMSIMFEKHKDNKLIKAINTYRLFI